MSPDVRDLLSDAVPPPRGADTDAILRRSAQIARRQRTMSGLAAALVVPLLAMGAVQLADRDESSRPDKLASSPSTSESPAGQTGRLGTVTVPAEGSAVGANLDDGRRVIVAHAPNGDVNVIDIASPVEVRGFRQSLAWCAASRRLVDGTSGALFDMHGGPASSDTRTFATTYRTERLDDTTLQVFGPKDKPGEPLAFGTPQPCTGIVTTLDVDGPASTVRAALATAPGKYVRVAGVLIVTAEGDAGICDRAVARRCQDDRGATSEGAPVTGLSAEARGRAVAGIFLARRSGDGFADVVRSSVGPVDPPARMVAYVHDVARTVNGQGYAVDYDEADMVTGDAATQYAYQSEGEVPVPNDYVIRNPDRVRAQTVTDDSTRYLLLDNAGGTPRQVTAEEFRQAVTARGPILVELDWDRASSQGMAGPSSLTELFLP